MAPKLKPASLAPCYYHYPGVWRAPQLLVAARGLLTCSHHVQPPALPHLNLPKTVRYLRVLAHQPAITELSAQAATRPSCPTRVR